MKDLLEIRDDIDVIDKEITRLYEERMRLTQEVAAFKISTGKAVLDRQRELDKLEALKDCVEGEYNKKSIVELFEQIMSMSRKRQYQMLSERGFAAETEFHAVERLNYEDCKIVFQGTEGAYSQVAMQEFFGKHIDSYNVETWRDAMEAIQSGEADYAVLPIENSSAGIVSENYDLLVEYNNCIIGEQDIPINHALLGLEEAELSDITDVYSHPQALMQCAKYLEEHRSWEKHSLKNTAASAKKIKEDGRINKAAIANSATAEIYGLKLLDTAIQDNTGNCTRFIVVTGKKIYEKKANKISICFELAHESGSLYRVLSHFIYNGLNMTKIESRPVQGKTWEYRFFINFEGNLMDAAVRNALRGLQEETMDLQILGCYTASEEGTAI